MEPLIRLRKALGITEIELAGKLGVTQTTLSRWESGTRDITMSGIKKICNMYGVSYEFLAGYSEKSGNEKIDNILSALDEIDRLRTELNV